MLNANKTITLFSKVFDSTEGYDRYVGTVLHNVSFFGELKSKVVDGGLKDVKQYTVRICSSSIESPNSIHMEEGDLIVLGQATTLTGLTPKQLKQAYSTVVTIISVTDNTDKLEPHWKVICQ